MDETSFNKEVGNTMGELTHDIETSIFAKLNEFNEQPAEFPDKIELDPINPSVVIKIINIKSRKIQEKRFLKIIRTFDTSAKVEFNEESTEAFVRMLRDQAKKSRLSINSKLTHHICKYTPVKSRLRVKNLTKFVSNELLCVAFSVFGEVERAIVFQIQEEEVEGIVDFVEENDAMIAYQFCRKRPFFLTSDIRPAIPELELKNCYYELDQGISETDLEKTYETSPQFLKNYSEARSKAPRASEEEGYEEEIAHWVDVFDRIKEKEQNQKKDYLQTIADHKNLMINSYKYKEKLKHLEKITPKLPSDEDDVEFVNVVNKAKIEPIEIITLYDSEDMLTCVPNSECIFAQGEDIKCPNMTEPSENENIEKLAESNDVQNDLFTLEVNDIGSEDPEIPKNSKEENVQISPRISLVADEAEKEVSPRELEMDVDNKEARTFAPYTESIRIDNSFQKSCHMTIKQFNDIKSDMMYNKIFKFDFYTDELVLSKILENKFVKAIRCNSWISGLNIKCTSENWKENGGQEFGCSINHHEHQTYAMELYLLAYFRDRFGRNILLSLKTNEVLKLVGIDINNEEEVNDFHKLIYSMSNKEQHRIVYDRTEDKLFNLKVTANFTRGSVWYANGEILCISEKCKGSVPKKDEREVSSSIRRKRESTEGSSLDRKKNERRGSSSSSKKEEIPRSESLSRRGTKREKDDQESPNKELKGREAKRRKSDEIKKSEENTRTEKMALEAQSSPKVRFDDSNLSSSVLNNDISPGSSTSTCETSSPEKNSKVKDCNPTQLGEMTVGSIMIWQRKETKPCEFSLKNVKISPKEPHSLKTAYYCKHCLLKNKYINMDENGAIFTCKICKLKSTPKTVKLFWIQIEDEYHHTMMLRLNDEVECLEYFLKENYDEMKKTLIIDYPKFKHLFLKLTRGKIYTIKIKTELNKGEWVNKFVEYPKDKPSILLDHQNAPSGDSAISGSSVEFPDNQNDFGFYRRHNLPSKW